jgi:hypothetical protein
VTPFPFVVGCGRSGTTLLRAMLDSHPELAIPGESYFVVELAARYRRRALRRFPLDRFLDEIAAHERFRKWGVPEETLREVAAERRPRDFADAMRAVFASYARHQGKPRYGDKTPAYVLDLPLLAELFPEGRFVHIIRDGRDVASSLLEIPNWGPEGIDHAAAYWRDRVAAGRRVGSELGAERYREVRYEDLVGDPDTTLRTICSFLELDYDPVMLRYPDRFDELTSSNLLPEQHQKLRRPPSSDVRDWRRELSSDDVRAFEGAAGELLADLGYELSAARS